MNLTLNLDTLTIHEVELLEEISGQGIDSIARTMSAQGEGKPMAKVLKAVAYIAARRDNPAVTLEEIGNLPISDLFQEEAPAAIPPTPASV